jgi:hypothetical protein
VSSYVRETTRDEITHQIGVNGRPLTREEFLEKQAETNASLRELKVMIQTIDGRLKSLGR